MLRLQILLEFECLYEKLSCLSFFISGRGFYLLKCYLPFMISVQTYNFIQRKHCLQLGVCYTLKKSAKFHFKV
jgi:hypothetical protein